jgi:hypothetical protein
MFFNFNKTTSPKPKGANRLALEGNLRRYIPECSHGSILITTKNKQTGIRLTRNRGVIEIEQINQAKSRQLIHKRLENNGLDPNYVFLFTARLKNLSLTLVQAAAFIQKNSLTVIKYFQFLD